MNWGGLPPGCRDRDCGEEDYKRPLSVEVEQRRRDRELTEALISITLSPLEVTALTMDCEDLLEMERRLS